MPRVSIIVLNYNGLKFLKKLIKSLSRQTADDFEVIVVDNCSTDGSLRLLEKILKKRNMRTLRLRVIKNDRNLGYCMGNNVGLQNSKGEYVVFLNNDTYVSERWLEELVRSMGSDPSIGACQSRLINPETREVETDGWLLDPYGWSQGIVIKKNDVVVSKLPFYASGASMICRRSVVSLMGGFDSELQFGDFDLCWRMRLIGYEIAVALCSLCYHYGMETTKRLFSAPQLVFHRDREVVRVLLKCYSIHNLVKRLPLSLATMIVRAMYCMCKYKKPSYMANFIKSLVWNLRRFRNTLSVRLKTQRLRNTPDSKIERGMQNYSVLLRRKWMIEDHEIRN